MARSTFLSWVILAALLAHAPLVGADKSPAAEAFARGTRLFEERSYVDAIAAFNEAYRLKPHFFVQCSIARCHENLNNFIEAAEHYRRCLKEGAGEAKVAERVRKSLQKVEAKIAWLTVESPGKGGTIHIDGRERGAAPGKVALDPGSHVVEVRREGATTANKTVELGVGEARTVELVPVDLPKREVPEREPEPAPVKRRKGLHPAWFWSTAALTAALTTTFVVLGVQSYQLRADYEDDPTKEGYDRFRDRRRLTNIFVGLAGAAAAGGTVLFFFTDFRGKERPSDRSAALGVGLQGSF